MKETIKVKVRIRIKVKETIKVKFTIKIKVKEMINVKVTISIKVKETIKVKVMIRIKVKVWNKIRSSIFSVLSERFLFIYCILTGRTRFKVLTTLPLKLNGFQGKHLKSKMKKLGLMYINYVTFQKFVTC